MIFRQITHDDLGCASYFIGDQKAGLAAVVDPHFEIAAYLDLSRFFGVRIEHVLETHNHADHVSGHGQLAAATGATIHIHRYAAAQYEHSPIDEGWVLELGDLSVRALHTPGHRPEHMSFVLVDARRGSQPWAVLGGDLLFVNDVGRPDLAVEKTEGARGIFHSLHRKLLCLPDDCEIWPGHLGGSMCGGPGMDLKVSSTIGFEKAHNPTLAILDEDAFVERALANLGPQPPNFEAIVALNQGPLLTDDVQTALLSPRQVEERRKRGALLVDVRSDVEFDEAHVPGSVSVPFARGGFGTKLAWLAGRDQAVVFIGRDGADGRRATKLALAIGVRTVAGVLEGGMTSWRQTDGPVEQLERITVEDLDDWLERGAQILDVRGPRDWEAGHIPGSFFARWHDIDAIPDGLDPERPIAVICASGQRALTAASLLQHLGAREVVRVGGGGVTSWGDLGHALQPGYTDIAPALRT